MASYHCSVKAGATGGGSSHSDYIEREGKYKAKTGKGDKPDDLEHSESGNLPSWAKDASDFWRQSDINERKNAAGYREIEIALPREMTPAQRLELVREFVRNEIGEKHAFTFAIHTPNAAIEGGEQPHAHIMFSERLRDGIERTTPAHYFKQSSSKDPQRGGLKKVNSARKTDAERAQDLVALRSRWAGLQNKHLERIGAAARVDHRSLQAQGIERQPEEHLGPKRTHTGSGLARAVAQARAERRQVEQSNHELAAAQRRVDRLIALQTGQRAKHSRQASQAVEQRDDLEIRASNTVRAWKELVAKKRAEYLTELTAKAKADVQAFAIRVKEHAAAQPRFIGRNAWEKERDRHAEHAHKLNVWQSNLSEKRYPFTESEKEAVQMEATKRAKAEQPKLEAIQPKAQAILMERNKRVMAERQAALRADMARKAAEPKREIEFSR